MPSARFPLIGDLTATRGGGTSMLGWLGPRCPLDNGEKLWTEFRMRWLAGKLGLDRLLGTEVILPQDRFLPDPYTATPADARRIFDRVCGDMKLDPDRFDLEVHPDDSIRGVVANRTIPARERPTDFRRNRCSLNPMPESQAGDRVIPCHPVARGNSSMPSREWPGTFPRRPG
jgi:hypothetical protein